MQQPPPLNLLISLFEQANLSLEESETLLDWLDGDPNAVQTLIEIIDDDHHMLERAREIQHD